MRTPEDGVLHHAAAFGGRGANRFLRVLVEEVQAQVFREQLEESKGVIQLRRWLRDTPIK